MGSREPTRRWNDDLPDVVLRLSASWRRVSDRPIPRVRYASTVGPRQSTKRGHGAGISSGMTPWEFAEFGLIPVPSIHTAVTTPLAVIPRLEIAQANRRSTFYT